MSPLVLTVAALAFAGTALAAVLATSTASSSSRRRDAARRRRHVARHPGLVNLGDVERRLTAELPRHQAGFVVERIARHRIDAATLWAWLERFGAEALVLALAADHGYAGILRLLRADAAYDLEELGVLARLSAPELFAEAACRPTLARN